MALTHFYQFPSPKPNITRMPLEIQINWRHSRIRMFGYSLWMELCEYQRILRLLQCITEHLLTNMQECSRH
jgi:hypothetical protein